MISTYTAATYMLYLAFSLLLTVWVGKTLHKHGRLFLVDAFGSAALADSVNDLLLVGFYLINLGYVTMNLKVGLRPQDVPQVIELLSYKIGVVAIVLGAMHFFNLYVFAKIRRSGLVSNAKPPVQPDAVVA